MGSLGGPEAINSPVQGGASDCTLHSGIRLDDEGHRLVLLVHDDLVVEWPERDADYGREYVEHVMAEEAARIYPEVKWKSDAEAKTRWKKKPTDEQVKEWLEGAGIGDDEEGL